MLLWIHKQQPKQPIWNVQTTIHTCEIIMFDDR
ncbi:hypothetical protein DERF_005639 [Dermatophagoides farinae]|uniref:Uncharacterized protein n=1 Tax=Dermatophagoides farinae TaxID=6954 RepID=A0A922I615_DERFA|nr:hypothetical protein DERF_005639 [Dermatophagoides farinae]